MTKATSKISKVTEGQSYFYTFNEKEIYNKYLSSTYKEEECKEVSYFINHYNEICYSKDIINFNKNNNLLIKDFPIKIVNNYDEYFPGNIGLLYNNSFFEEIKSFITLLKAENIIENYYYFLNFDEIIPLKNIIKGQLYIGNLPHEIFPKKYFLENFQCSNSYIEPFIPPKWRIIIDKIYLNDKFEQFHLIDKSIILSYEIYHIIGTLEFHNKIKEMFMDQFIYEKQCYFSNFSQNIYGKNNISFYYCKKTMKNKLYENLNNIKFYSMKFEYAFQLDKEELFYIKDDYIYLNILFSEEENTYWTMGQIFTIKYNFAFETNQKQICLYKKINNSNIKKDDNINSIKSQFLVIIIFIICILIFTWLGIIIGRKIFGWRRKLIANEIIEELNYEYRIENNEVKSNNIQSKYKTIGNKDKNLFFEMKNKTFE